MIWKWSMINLKMNKNNKINKNNNKLIYNQILKPYKFSKSHNIDVSIIVIDIKV